MNTMVFELSDTRGRRESVVVEGARASIGSASHCDVRLPMEDAGPEQVRVTRSGDELRFEAVLATPPVLLDGRPLAAGSVAAGVELRLGQTRLRVRALSTRAASAARAGRTSPRPTWLLALGACSVLALLALVLLGPRPAAAPLLDEQLELFSQLSPSCPRREPQQALAFAQQQQDLAETKQERMPFVVDEGVAAVDAFELSAACFRAGGAAALGEQASAAARRLQRELEDNLRARRLRLSRMLLVEDHALARVDVAWLRALLRGRRHAYVGWLDSLASELGVQEAP